MHFFLYTVFLLSPRGVVKVVQSMQQWEKAIQITTLEREMLNLTLSSSALCVGPSQKGFCFRLYNVKKKNYYCYTLLTTSCKGAGGL